MKKLLILILIVLLATVAYMMAFKNIKIGKWETTNIEQLETLDKELDDDIEKARELNETTYTTKIDDLNKSIKNLQKTKETYEAKISNMSEDAELGIVSIKNYKIEYLWTKLENYAKDNGVWLKLDLIENGGENYDLDITLRGSYIDITETIFDIEKDDTLDFIIEEFKLVPSTTTKATTTTNTPTLPNDSETITPSDANNNSTSNSSNNSGQTVVVDATVLEATFSIKDVNVELN